jgi:hypothetical protein
LGSDGLASASDTTTSVLESLQRSGRSSGRDPAATTTTAVSQRGSSVTTTTITVAAGLPPEHCPEPKTCRHYSFANDSPPRYPAGEDGRATIEYWMNPSGLDTSTITVEQVEGALAAAFDTWQRAAPTLHFVYRGRTDRLPVTGDGVNVVGFQGAGAFTPVAVTYGRPEFDMRFGPTGWVWRPCEQRDGACTRLDYPELQGAATHEAGHAVWLDHVTDQNLDRYMTMWPGDNEQGYGDRFWQTLGLGDVLGIRALYPCSCPLPTIYDP